LHFGIGKAEVVDGVEIRWPDGVIEKLQNVKANQTLKLVHELQPSGAQP
jgi:hypothetical protein